MERLLKGQVLRFSGDPFIGDPEQVASVDRNGAVLIRDKRIAWVGPADEAPFSEHITDYGDGLIMPGFIDAHVHYPQTAIIASWGKRLIDWLNTYTFPEEARFGDAAYAEDIAERYFDLTLMHGTTTVCSYATIHPESVNAFFRAAQRRDLRALSGKTCMDRNAPDTLRDTAQLAYDQSKDLLETWNGVERLNYVITPRFAPTSSPEQLTALGALWSEYPDCLMQTHLSEQVEEIEWVRQLYPDARDYLDVYERHGLLGPGGVYGHAIHLQDREIDRIRDIGASLVHCPTSNAFIGSGLFKAARLKSHGLKLGLATDTGGGSSFSMLRTMASAYEIGQLAGTSLHPAQLLWLATQGSAEALHLGDKIGAISEGREADLVVLDLASTPAISQRSAQADTAWEAIFPTIMMGDDRAIRDVWVNGTPVQQPERPRTSTQ